MSKIFDRTIFATTDKLGYKEAIINCLHNIEENIDDVLGDYDKGIKDITLTIHCSMGEIALINVAKNYYAYKNREEDKYD